MANSRNEKSRRPRSPREEKDRMTSVTVKSSSPVKYTSGEGKHAGLSVRERLARANRARKSG